ncbi:MAG: hypothetical protein C4330_08215 [Chitinophagaceae bacterium]
MNCRIKPLSGGQSFFSDNGACYIASELQDYLKSKGIRQVHGKINHPQTKGKIER